MRGGSARLLPRDRIGQSQCEAHMGSHLKIQLLGLAIVAWIGSGLADRHHLPFAEIILALTAIVAGILMLLPRS